MNTLPFAGKCRRGLAAFTLIELLAVMTIILILAGLILAIAGNANYKAAQSRAQGEIKALSAACEAYKTDNGAYPRVTKAQNATDNTDGLDARGTTSASTDPTASGNPSYSQTSTILYQLLCGAYTTGTNGLPIPTPPPAAGAATQTVYYNFTPSQLAGTTPNPNTGYINPTQVTAINDPFGFSYGYSTAYQADVDANNATNPPGTTPPTHGFNPTFDLWSTAGYSSSGKTYPTNMTATNYNTLWVKNW